MGCLARARKPRVCAGDDAARVRWCVPDARGANLTAQLDFFALEELAPSPQKSEGMMLSAELR